MSQTSSSDQERGPKSFEGGMQISRFNRRKGSKRNPYSHNRNNSMPLRSSDSDVSGDELDEQKYMSMLTLISHRQSIASIADEPVHAASSRGRADSIATLSNGPTHSYAAQNPLMELENTEKAYLNHIQVFVKVFANPWSSMGGKELAVDPRVSILLANVEQVYIVNATFYEAYFKFIQRLENRGDFPLHIYEFEEMGKFFQHWASCFDVYIRLGRNYDLGYSAFKAAISRSKQLALFIKSSEMTPSAAGLTFWDFLIMPLQRIPRYRLLLEKALELAKTVDSGYNFVELRKAISDIGDVANRINESIREREMSEKLYCLKHSFAGLGFDLIGRKRRLIRESPIQAKGPDGNLDMMAYLFNDVLVCCKRSSKDKLKVQIQWKLDTLRVLDVARKRSSSKLVLEKNDSLVEFSILDGSVLDWKRDIQCLSKHRQMSAEQVDALRNNDGTASPCCTACRRYFDDFNQCIMCARCNTLICEVCSGVSIGIDEDKQPECPDCQHNLHVRTSYSAVSSTDKRCSVLKKLLKEEHEYLQDLENICNDFLRPILVFLLPQDVVDTYGAHAIGVPSDAAVVFDFFEQITVQSRNVLSLVRLMSTDTDAFSRNAESLYDSVAVLISLVISYGRRYYRSLGCLSVSPFQEAIAELEKRAGKTPGTLQRYIARPLERVARYQKFFAKLLSLSEKNDPAYSSLYSVIDRLAEAINGIEELAHQEENVATIRVIESMLQPKQNLLGQGRKFIAADNFVFIAGRVTKPYRIFLFSDVFIVAKKKSDGKVFGVKYVIPLANCSVFNTHEIVNSTFVWGVTANGKVLKFGAEREEVRAQWIGLVDSSIASCSKHNNLPSFDIDFSTSSSGLRHSFNSFNL